MQDVVPVHEIDVDETGEDRGAELDEAEEEKDLGGDPTTGEWFDHFECFAFVSLVNSDLLSSR